MILVSHDRHLIEACADRLLLVADGRAVPFDGDLDDYQKLVLSQRGTSGPNAGRDTERAPQRAGRADLRRAAAERRVALAPLRRRIADAEAAVVRLNAEIARIDALLAGSGLFARDPAKAATLAKARADHVSALAKAEEDWLEASALEETATRDSHSKARRSDGVRRCSAILRASGAGGFFRSCLLRFGGCRRWARRSLDRDQSAADKAVNPGGRPTKICQDHDALASIVSADIDLFDRACSSHNVAFRHLQCDPARAGSTSRRRRVGKAGCLLRRGGAYAIRIDKIGRATGRSEKSVLPGEIAAQSGLRIMVSGLGTRVRLFRLRSDEHPATASASAATVMCNGMPFNRCIASPRPFPPPALQSAKSLRRHHDLDQ